MNFQVNNGSFTAAASNNHINSIAHSDTPPEMGIWEKIEDFFCTTNKPEALECIRRICHPSGGTTWEDVISKFEQLRTLAYPGYEDNIQFGRHGESHLCILDADSREILFVSLDEAGKYTVKCQGHNETHNLSLGTELRAEDYEAVWAAWENIAPPEESCHRAEAVQKMRDCLNNGNPELDLSNLNITTLPDRLPPNMVRLNIDKNRLTSLPELPPGLQTLTVNNNQLTSLPELPSGLQTLRASSNRLTSLSELPSGLQTLRASSNRLTSLPELPSGLYILEIDRNRLGYLPELPPELLELMVDYNELASLPELPPGLQELAVKSNRLDSLPTLPSGLLGLTATDNELTSLPELPSGLFELVVNNNELASLPELPSGIQELMVNNNALTRLPELPSGLKRLWANHNDLTSLPALPSGLRALTVIQNRLNSLPALPSGLRELTVNDNRLTQLVEDDELRAKTFVMATEATSSCEDRVTLALNKMKNVQLVHNAEKGEFNDNLPGLVSVGREMFRLEKLEQIAREKVNTLRFVDEIEVYLGYQNKLKQPLELTSVTAEMRFFGVSGVTGSDLQSAEIQVKTAENSQFAEWILQWEPLRKVLERTAPASWEALCEKKISDYENTYRILSDTELKPAGLLGNTDAERIVGTRAMENAEKAFLDGLQPLAANMLGRYLKPRWS